MPTYEDDFYAWTQQQAALLRNNDLDAIDRDNLAEEIAAMGRRERHEISNRLTVLLTHLLKWQYQPERRCRSWSLTVEEQHRRVARLIRDNPSLRAMLTETLTDAYGDAVLIAARETGLAKAAFPEQCPWQAEQVLAGDFPVGPAD